MLSVQARGAALWSAQAHMPSVVDHRIEVVSGHGSTIVTSDGRELIDAPAGLWHANVGHGRRELAEAAYEQMKKLETYHVFGSIANNVALDLADRVSAISPIPNAKVFWTSGGSDAIDLACKLTRRYWTERGEPNRKVIISRDNAYHGMHGFGTSIAGIAVHRADYGSVSLIPDTARVSNSDLAAVSEVIDRIGGNNIGAIVVEPVMGTGGLIPPSAGYLDGLQQLALDHGFLFIVDEVITGFGRTGMMFATELYGLQPDMVVVAKGITSGYAALGGVLVAERVWEPFFSGRAVFRHGITYSGHATACAVAQANLDLIESEGLVERVAHLGPVLADALHKLDGHRHVQEVRTAPGLLGGVQLRNEVDGDSVVRHCLGEGVLTRVITDNTLQISPPFVISEDEIRCIAEALVAALDAV